MIEQVNFEKMGGIVPAIVEDAGDGRVLMLGFMNREALKRTLDERQVYFWSRSKSRLWKKGETSGNILNLVSVHMDCDQDTLLVRVQPTGPVCHTGGETCFASAPWEPDLAALRRLVSVIRERKERMPDGSYTAKLFKEGIAKIAQKVGEEAVELAIAAQYPDTHRCVEETADLFYHTLVLLAGKGIELSDVFDELERRMKQYDRLQ